MALTGEFVPTSADCLPDGQGGFTLVGPDSHRQPPALRLTTSGGVGALIVRIEISVRDGRAAGLLASVQAGWRTRLEGMKLAPDSVATADSAPLAAPSTDLAVPLRVSVLFHDVNPFTGRPVVTVQRTVQIATTLHLTKSTVSPSPPVPAAEPAPQPTPDARPAHETRPAQHAQPVQEWKHMPSQQLPAIHRVNPGEHAHEGWAAVDFGTTNTTVTLFDQQRLDLLPMSADQERRLRSKLIALLGKEPPAGARQGWQRLIETSAQHLLRQPVLDPSAGGPTAVTDREAQAHEGRGSAAQALIRALEAGMQALSPHAVYTELEKRLPGTPEATRRYAAEALHVCSDLAFREPPLDVLRLFPVELEPGAGEIPSRIEVTEAEPELRVRVGTPLATSPGSRGGAPLVFFSRKQFLGRDHEESDLPARDDSSPRTSDDLIREALRFLLGQTDAFIAARPGAPQAGRIDHVVATYPTVAPPAVRRRLKELLAGGAPGIEGLGVTIVEDAFDEAIAAALFGLMRDFGGDSKTGVQAFRARSRPVPGADRHWQQNVLVADIGGGTTDIALVRLGLREQTPPLNAALDPRFTGRRYVITPTLLGSTGHLHLGGERITLRLFTWFKAAFADYLLRSDSASYAREIAALQSPYVEDGYYVAGSLCQEQLLSRTGYPHDKVDALVRTRWKVAPASERAEIEQTFWLLWNLAEEAKRELGTDAPSFTAEPQQVADILRRAYAERGDAAAVPGPDQVADSWAPTMRAADFEALIEPILQEIASLAVPLVSEPLSDTPVQAQGGDHGEYLDRIILTGKSSAMPIVRRAIERALGVGPDSVVTWNPADVTVENDYAKLATSIGACWAEHVRRYAFDEKTVREAVERGRWELEIEVDNLRYNLPANFEQVLRRDVQGGEATLPLLWARTPLSPSGEGGRWIARSRDWRAVLANLEIRRRTGPGNSIPWGVFRPETSAVEHQEPDLPFTSAQYRREVCYQLEIDIDLTPRLHLTRAAAPDYLVPRGAGIEVKFEPAVEGDWRPVQIVVGPQVAGDRPDPGTIVFDLPQDPAGQEADPLSGANRFDRRFYSPDATGDPAGDPSEVRRGMVSRTRLPPPVSASWSFHLFYPDQPDQLVAIRHLPVPDLSPGEPVPERAEYVATLDEDRLLAVHRAEIPYRKAATLAEMWQHPGSVLEVTMSDSSDERVEDYDPFNGNH